MRSTGPIVIAAIALIALVLLIWLVGLRGPTAGEQDLPEGLQAEPKPSVEPQQPTGYPAPSPQRPR